MSKVLSIREDFFNDKRIKYIKKLENGDTFIIIFMKFISNSDLSDEDDNLVVKAFEVFKNVGLLDIKIDTIKTSNPITCRNRNHPKYRFWRKSVFERDNYTCVKCGVRGKKLNAHHVIKWSESEADRFEIDNGITLCVKCHKEQHSKAVK